MENVRVVLKDFARAFVVAIHNIANFQINNPRRFIRNVFMPGHRAPQEHFALFFAIHQRPQLVGQTPLRHHIARNRRGAFNIVRRAGRHLLLAINHFFRQTPAVERGNLAFQALLGIAVAILIGQEHGHPQSATTGNNGHFIHRIMRRHETPDNAMPGFVIRGHFLFLIAHHHGTAFRAHHDFILGVFHILHGDRLAIATRGKKRRFINQIGEIRAGKAGRAAGNIARIDFLINRLFAHMHFKNLLTPLDIRQAHRHLTVKTSRTQQSRIKHIRTVGRGNHNHAFIAFKTVHFHQQLVQGLLALIMTAAQTCTALTSHRINLINKDNARRMFFRFFKHIAHPRRAHADKHFHKIRTGNGKKRHLRFAGNRPRQQGFARSRRPDHQHAARNLSAQTAEFGGITQKFHHFHHIMLGFIGAGNILKSHLNLIFGD